MEIFLLEERDDVLYVSIEIDIHREEFLPLSEPRESGCMNNVPERFEARRNISPAPSPVPGAVHQDEGTLLVVRVDFRVRIHRSGIVSVARRSGSLHAQADDWSPAGEPVVGPSCGDRRS